MVQHSKVGTSELLYLLYSLKTKHLKLQQLEYTCRVVFVILALQNPMQIRCVRETCPQENPVSRLNMIMLDWFVDSHI